MAEENELLDTVLESDTPILNGVMRTFAPPAQIPNCVVQTLRRGTYRIEMRCSPGERVPSKDGSPCHFFCIGSSLSLVKLDPNSGSETAEGYYLCADRNWTAYGAPSTSSSPFRTSDLGEPQVNTSLQLAQLPSPGFDVTITAPRQAIRIYCYLLCEQDGDGEGPFGIGRGPYGEGRWIKRYEVCTPEIESKEAKKVVIATNTYFVPHSLGFTILALR